MWASIPWLSAACIAQSLVKCAKNNHPHGSSEGSGIPSKYVLTGTYLYALHHACKPKALSGGGAGWGREGVEAAGWGSIRPITSLQILATIIDHETDPSVVLQIDAEACADFED